MASQEGLGSIELVSPFFYPICTIIGTPLQIVLNLYIQEDPFNSFRDVSYVNTEGRKELRTMLI
jgi:hypothetical protein